MPLVRQSIPAFYGGVSQQAAVVRSPSQLEAATNCFLTIAEGCSKRPPLEVFNELASADMRNYFFHWMPSSTGDWFLIVIPGDGTIETYRLSDGALLNGELQAGVTYFASTGPARDAFRAYTVGKDTYIVNREVTVGVTASVSEGSIMGTAQTLQDNVLDTAPEGSIWVILGDEVNAFDTHYAKKVGGKWVEWVQPEIPDEIDPATMPHVLFVSPDEVNPLGFVWDAGQLAWTKRRVGDAKSNKWPGFVGNRINGISFVSDRLVLLSENKVCMSETGEHRNFMRTTVTDVLDTDRIDVTVASDDVSFIHWAKPIARSLILFSEGRQFSFDWQGALTPRTSSITQATAFPVSQYCEPVSAGSNLYFASESGDYASCMEMFIQKDVAVTDAANVTAHVPRYIPRNVRLSAAHNNFDMVILGSAERPGSLFVYKHYWQGDQKVQSAWSEWTFDGIEIVSIKVIDEFLYAVFYHDGKTYVGRLNLKLGDPGLAEGLRTHPIHLDYLTVHLTPEFNSSQNRTVITSSFPVFSDDFIARTQLVRLNLGTVITSTSPVKFTKLSDNSAYVTGDYSAIPLALGVQYTQSFTLSEQFWDVNNRSVLNARVQLRSMNITFTGTAFFETTVTVRGVNPSTGSVIPLQSLVSSYTSRTLGDGHFLLNSPQLADGSYRFPVLAQTKDVSITITNDSYLPANFQSAEWEALVVTRTR